MAQDAAKVTGTRGEITPLAQDRQDTELYRDAVARCFNWIVLKLGGWRRRSGSMYTGTNKNNGEAYNVEFLFNKEQAYNLEFGDGYLRVWFQDGGYLAEFPSPYTKAQAEEAQYHREGDVLFIAHKDVAPQQLNRLGHTNWVFEPIEFDDGPYEDINDNADWSVTTSAPATRGAVIDLTWNDIAAINDGTGFNANDVGRWVRFQIAGVWFVAKIDTIQSTTVVTVTVVQGFNINDKPQFTLRTDVNGSTANQTADADKVTSNNGTTISWRLGLFGNDPLYTGWPGAVTGFESRIVWGSTYRRPRTAFFGRSGLPLVMSPSDADGTVIDTHAFNRTIRGGNQDEILWMREDQVLLVGTCSTVRQFSSTSDGFVGPRNIKQSPAVPEGAGPVNPVAVGNSWFFASPYLTRLHEIYYDAQFRSFVAPDTSVPSEHLIRGKLKRLAYQREPDSILWGLTEEGELFGLTIEKFERIRAYHSHDVSGFIEDILVLPSGDGRDVLWLQVRREINGATVRYKELLQPQFDDNSLEGEAYATEAFMVDCGLTYRGPAVSTITGLDHLEGEEVHVLADGAVSPVRTVVGGSITLANNQTAETIHIGLPIPNEVETLPPQIQTRQGSPLGVKQRIKAAIMSCYQTLGLYVSAPGRPTEAVRFRLGSDKMDQGLPLFSGKQKVTFDNSWEDEGAMVFTVPQPLPATVKSLNIKIETE